MTQPPQQPDPEGSQPQGGQQPPADGGFAAFPPGPTAADPTGTGPLPAGTGEPPRRNRSGMITAIVIAAVLVLAGGGTGVYFLTKGDDDPSPSASSNSSAGNVPPTTTSGSAPTGSGGAVPPPSGGGQPPASGAAPTSGGTGGGGGAGTGSPEDDAKIVEIAQKYASAVTNKDEGAAKSVTCDKEAGLLFNDVQKVEVTGKPEKYGDDTASIGVKITIPEQDPIDNFPLFMGKESNVWCISN